MKKISQITKEQEDAMPSHVQKWVNIGLCTERIDKSFARDYGKRLNEMLRREHKGTIIVDGPLHAFLAVLILNSNKILDLIVAKHGLNHIVELLFNCKSHSKFSKPNSQLNNQCELGPKVPKVRDQVANQVEDSFEDQVWSEIWDPAINRLWDQVADQVEDSVSDQVWDKVWDQVRAQVGDQVGYKVRDQAWDQVRAQVEGQVEDQVGNQVEDSVSDQVRAQVGDQVWDQVVSQAWVNVGRQVQDQASDQVWNQVGNQVEDSVSDQVWDKVWDQAINQVQRQVNDQVANQAVDQIGSEVDSYVMSQVGFQVGFQARTQVTSKVRRQVESYVMSQAINHVKRQLLTWVLQIGDQVRSQVEVDVWNQVMSQVADQVSNQVNGQVGSQIWNQAMSQIENQVKSEVWVQVLNQVEDNLHAKAMRNSKDLAYSFNNEQNQKQIKDFFEKKIDDLIKNEINKELNKNSFVWPWLGGSLSSVPWASWATFFRDYFKLTLDDFSIIEDNAYMGPVWPINGWVVISEKCNVIKTNNGRLHCEDGPAWSYADGTKGWSIDGVALNEQVVMSPETQTLEQINEEKNNDIKSIRIERYGLAKYLKEMNAKTINERKNDIEGTLETLLDLNGDKYLWPTCPSGKPCPPLGVPSHINTCEEASHWLGGSKETRIIGRT